MSDAGVSPYVDGQVTVYQGDCLQVLRQLPDASVDAVVTDPPAGIGFMGKAWDTFSREYLDRSAEQEAKRKNLGPHSTSRPGRKAARTSSAFGDPAHYAGAIDRSPEGRRAFIAFMTEVMVECLRVLKPGGHALVWAIPRTSHWTGMAIEDAGFEVRDFVCHHFGSGFPKSLDVSKAIDKAAGAEREIVRYDASRARPNRLYESGAIGNVGGNGTISDRTDNGATITTPATDAAKQWQGWGTALKPATEIWWEARKPLAEPTVAAQVLATGTGAIHIDACRVGGADAEAGRVRHGGGTNGVYAQDEWTKANQSSMGHPMPSGRWPANLVLTHSADCRQVGTRTVQPKDGHRVGPVREQADGSIQFTRKPVGFQKSGYTDPDGTETVEAWECVEGCPVAELDRQSGTLTSGANPTRRGSDKFRDTYGEFVGQRECTPARGADQGGASRFFYTAKASARERNEGLPKGTRNMHPTVKPIALMRWLCRLITPPGGVVLDPFAGSGTTLLAAKLEGFRSIGIEMEPEHVEIIKRRLGWATHQPPLFDPEAA